MTTRVQRSLLTLLFAIASVPLAAQAAESTIVIRSDPSLMTLTPEALSSLLSQTRLRAVADAIGKEVGTEDLWVDASVRVDAPSRQVAPVTQPAGVFVGTLRVSFLPNNLELSTEQLSNALNQVAGILEQQLRVRLEHEPLDRLRNRSSELRKRLDDVAARQRVASSNTDLRVRLQKLEDDRAMQLEESTRYEVELSSEMAVRQRLEDELTKLAKDSAGLTTTLEVAARLDRAQTDLANTTARLQRMHATIELARARVRDTDARLTELRNAPEPSEDANLLAAEFDRVANALARVEERIADFRLLEFEIWR